VGGAGLYRAQNRHLERKVEDELSAVVRLKAEQVSEWRNSHLRDGFLSSGSPIFVQSTSRWLARREPSGTRQLLAQFKSFSDIYGYADVILTDAQGVEVLSLGGGMPPEIVSDVAKLGMEVCVTLGMLKAEQARRLKAAGATVYNHNIDSSREFYETIISTRKFDDRLKTIRAVR